MKTLDATALIKKSKERSRSDQEWLDAHDGEFDDLVYEEQEGRVQSYMQGSMVGSPHVFGP